jgi:hypothetical protein
MQLYSTTIKGILLKVRRTDSGWEASISGPASVMDQETANSMAEKFAADILGGDPGPIEWEAEN